MIKCVRCKGEDESCSTCFGKGEISMMHSELFDLGFTELRESISYRLILSKVLNKFETISVELERIDNDFKIIRLEFNGPKSREYFKRISSVNDLVNFLYSV